MGGTKENLINLEAAAWLLKPLQLEQERNYPNTAVAGGLEQWILRLKENLIHQAGFTPGQADLLLLPLEHYSQASPILRQKKIEAVYLQLQKLSFPGVSASANLSPETSPPKLTRAKAKSHPHPLPSLAQREDRPYAFKDPVQYLKGVGPQRARLLKKMGIITAMDLLRHFPRDWQDRREIKKIMQITTGEIATVCGQVQLRTTFSIRRGLVLTKIVLDDGTGRIEATWFNQPFMRDRFQDGQRVLVHGKVEFHRTWQVANPEYEILEDEKEDLIHTARIVPIYPLTEHLSQRVLRSILYALVHRLPTPVPEIIPLTLVPAQHFPAPEKALAEIHFPSSWETLDAARRRFIFEELFLQQVAVVRTKKRYQREPGRALNTQGPLLSAFLANLPFTLTQAQHHARQQILSDLSQARTMHRLLQGDVGSGKTIVAVLALLAAVDSQQQAALMAPTEVLAAQHYFTLKKLLSPLGVRIELFTSSIPAKERRRWHAQLESGEIQIAIGTHALTQEKTRFSNLALVVIDEQHRFGVQQRAQLRAKGQAPHVLVLTATPIPRTLAMTVYGDLDVSTLDEMPPGRLPIMTKWLRPARANAAYAHVHQEIASGRQAYIIFPLIEESEKLDLKALAKEFERLQHDLFPGKRIGLLHGRMIMQEKERVMQAFKTQELEILAATSVVEVGIDMPNATIMVIEDADRFGLAQLHQLRGRVGRGVYPAFCYLIADPKNQEGKNRLSILTRVQDGFKLAEEDLALRGPGEFFGLRQHGQPELKLANLVRDVKSIELAQKTAMEILEKDPEMKLPEHQALKQVYQSLYLEHEQRVLAG